MNAFFGCMAKFADVEVKCAAERRALTNCATAAVRWRGPRQPRPARVIDFECRGINLPVRHLPTAACCV